MEVRQREKSAPSHVAAWPRPSGVRLPSMPGSNGLKKERRIRPKNKRTKWLNGVGGVGKSQLAEHDNVGKFTTIMRRAPQDGPHPHPWGPRRGLVHNVPVRHGPHVRTGERLRKFFTGDSGAQMRSQTVHPSSRSSRAGGGASLRRAETKSDGKALRSSVGAVSLLSASAWSLPSDGRWPTTSSKDLLALNTASACEQTAKMPRPLRSRAF